MKKLLALVLAATMALSLMACGGGNTDKQDAPSQDTTTQTSEPTTPESEVFHLGDTVTFDDIELTLTRFEFGDILDNSTSYKGAINEDYLLPITDEVAREAYRKNTDYQLKIVPNLATYEATEGHIMVAFSFEVKSNSKTALRFDDIFDRVDIDYDDGYLFENSGGFHVNLNDSWESASAFLDKEIEPLDSTVYEFRGYAEVPEEVMNNTEKALNLNVYIDNEFVGRTTPDIVFNIR